MESNGSTSMATRLLRRPRAPGRRRAAQEPVAGISVRPRHRVQRRPRSSATPCSPTSSAAKITSATWTSSSAAPTRRHRLPARPQAPRHLAASSWTRPIYRTRDARMKVLDVMNAALAAPRTELSKYAPRIETHEDQPRQDRHAHRARRQEHQRHRRRDRLRDQHRGRRHRAHLLEQPRRHGPRASRSSTA